jgi:hypothetical protein
MAPGVRQEKGHLAPEVRVANEIAYDRPCMGQAVTPPPISVTCSKWYIRKVPLVLRSQPLDSRTLSCHCWPD